MSKPQRYSVSKLEKEDFDSFDMFLNNKLTQGWEYVGTIKLSKREFLVVFAQY